MDARKVALASGAGVLLWIWISNRLHAQAVAEGYQSYADATAKKAAAGQPSGGIMADVAKALGLVTTAAGIYKGGAGLVKSGADLFGARDVAQTVESTAEKAASFFGGGGVGADAVAGTVGGQTVTWGDVAANPELAYAIAAEGTAAGTGASAVAGYIGGQAVTWGEIAANPELALVIAEAGTAIGGSVVGTVGGVAVTEAMLAASPELAYAIALEAGATVAAETGTTAAAAGTGAAVGGASAALAAGALALPAIFFAIGYSLSETAWARRVEELGSLIPDVSHALIDNGPAGAVTWLVAAQGWPDTGRGWSYANTGVLALTMFAYGSNRSPGSYVTDPSAWPWEWAVHQATQGMETPDLPPLGWYIGILQQNRYPGPEDFAAYRATQPKSLRVQIQERADYYVATGANPNPADAYYRAELDFGVYVWQDTGR